eukprot:2305028-Prymnesium_polylepis.1
MDPSTSPIRMMAGRSPFSNCDLSHAHFSPLLSPPPVDRDVAAVMLCAFHHTTETASENFLFPRP